MTMDGLPDTPFSMITAFNVSRICGLISIPLHCLVIGAVIRYRNNDLSMKNCYFHMLANLCAIDLIRVIQLLILKTWLYSLEGWRTSNQTMLPRFDGVCQFFAYQANLLQLTAIAFNRLLEMALPLKAKTIWTSKITICANVGSWIFGFSFAIPLLLPAQHLEHLPLYQGIFWSNNWDNQTEADVDASKAYMDFVSKAGIIFSGLLLGIYIVTFGIMINFRINQNFHSSQANWKYKAEVNLTIQAVMLTSFVFVYNISLFLYTRDCCPLFVATNLVAMLWAAHYSGPMLALAMSSILRRNVKRLLTLKKNGRARSEQKETATVTTRMRLIAQQRKWSQLEMRKNRSWTYKENPNQSCGSTEEKVRIFRSTEV